MRYIINTLFLRNAAELQCFVKEIMDVQHCTQYMCPKWIVLYLKHVITQKYKYSLLNLFGRKKPTIDLTKHGALYNFLVQRKTLL